MQISQHVRVRGERWRVADIRAFDDCQLVTLSSLTPPDVGAERQMLAPFDAFDPTGGPRRHRLVRGRRWRRACRSLVAAEAPPGRLWSARLARFDLMPHQLEPALAVLRGKGSRILLADEVGLGKTIQAGLIVAELRARGAIDRLLVLTPAGLRDQWAQELSTRFAIEAPAVDGQTLRRLITTLPVGVNPWTATPMAVASVDYVKRPEVLPAVAACRWDVVIVDEAHGVAGHSERRGAIERLASRAAYVLLVTATPHSGDRRTFVSLCGLGSAADDELVVFRRSRSDVGFAARRHVRTLRVRPSAAEWRMHALLGRYSAAVRAERHDGWLALSVLHKRALSSAWSLAQSVERRLLSPSADRPIGGQLVLPLGDPDGDRATADEPPAWPDDIGLADIALERRLLTALASAARLASVGETKLAALERLLRRAAEPAIVFTEYRDTLLHVHRALARPTAVLHGGLSRDDRARALAAFSHGSQTVLLATDAAGEGLNLHHACRLVINLELPWNPMRLEQRVGRVDRIGQRRAVHAVHLVAAGTGEERVLSTLKERLARARADIGVPDVFGADAERATARIVVTGEEAAPETGGLDHPSTCVDGLMLNLRKEAVDEAQRLTKVRALTHAQDDEARLQMEGGGPWVTTSRRRTTRQRMGGHVLLVWRVTCDDAHGRPVESRIVPVTIPITGARHKWRARARLGPQLRELDAHVRPSVEQAVDDWRRSAEANVRAFVSTRLRREEAIAGHSTPDAFQAGLFDRRADRMHDTDRAAAADADDRHASHLAALARAATLTFPPAQLLLVLVP
jgi:superfamily II DNA or RNA helicase